MIRLELSEEHVQIIWGLLGDAPLKISLPVWREIERQIAEQKAPPQMREKGMNSAPGGITKTDRAGVIQ